MAWSSEPVVITVAPTGAEVTREQTPYLPVTPLEIADEVTRSADEGASVVHIHAREDDGRPTTDPEILAAIVALIRERTDVVVGISTGAEVGMSTAERTRVLDAQPEIASLNCGSMNFGDVIFDNAPELIRSLAQRMLQDGIRPELEIYDIGMLGMVQELFAEGLVSEPLLYNFVMGVRGGIPALPANLMALLSNLPHPGAWSVTGIGRHQLPLTALAAAMGGHVRVGLEDNIYYRRGQLARSNAELVARARRVVEELERPIASPTEARLILGVVK